MQIRLIGKLCLGLAACLVLDAFSTTARGGMFCQIYRANIILRNESTIYGFFNIISFDEPYTTGTEIQDYIKRNRWPTLTIHRKLQTIRYPKGQVFAAAHEDIVEVPTSNIRTIEYLSRMDCQSLDWPTEIISLPQRAINLLQKVPFALVETPTYEYNSDICLSYNKHIGKPTTHTECCNCYSGRQSRTSQFEQTKPTSEFQLERLQRSARPLRSATPSDHR